MNRLFIFLSALLLVACTSLTKDKLSLLNGYWEIDRVEFPNGGQKDYKMNTTVDFIQLEGIERISKKNEAEI